MKSELLPNCQKIWKTFATARQCKWFLHES